MTCDNLGRINKRGKSRTKDFDHTTRRLSIEIQSLYSTIHPRGVPKRLPNDNMISFLKEILLPSGFLLTGEGGR